MAGSSPYSCERLDLDAMDAKQLYDAGDLPGAIQAVTTQIQKAPTNIQLRTFFFELLCFQGDWDRALKQLDILAKQGPEAEWGAQAYRNMIAAEKTRQEFFSDSGGDPAPDFFREPPDYVQKYLDAADCCRKKENRQAKLMLHEAMADVPALDGTCNGEDFSVFRDWDDLMAPFLEFYMISDYVWVPFEHIKEFEVSTPEHPRDLIWAPTKIRLHDDTLRCGYVPATYIGSHANEDVELKLGRAYDWIEAEGLLRGQGMKVYRADGRDLKLPDLKSVIFADEEQGAEEESAAAGEAATEQADADASQES